jgi:hypothetical protein
MSKVPPTTQSFVAWQQAAASLLTLETALSRSKRAVPAAGVLGDAALEALVAQQRAIADGLFKVAFAEAHEHLDSGRRPSPAAAHRVSPQREAQVERCS